MTKIRRPDLLTLSFAFLVSIAGVSLASDSQNGRLPQWEFTEDLPEYFRSASWNFILSRALNKETEYQLIVVNSLPLLNERQTEFVTNILFQVNREALNPEQRGRYYRGLSRIADLPEKQHKLMAKAVNAFHLGNLSEFLELSDDLNYHSHSIFWNLYYTMLLGDKRSLRIHKRRMGELTAKNPLLDIDCIDSILRSNIVLNAATNLQFSEEELGQVYNQVSECSLSQQ